MADFLLLFLIIGYCIFVIVHRHKKAKKEASLGKCPGTCAGCGGGCTFREELENKEISSGEEQRRK